VTKIKKDTRIRITQSEMVKAIQRSGYLIERRVSDKFNKSGYTIVPNQIIVDPETNKTREIDLVAMSINYNSTTTDHYGFEIICECENNFNPIVFFTQEFDKHLYLSEVKSSGFKSIKQLFKYGHKDYLVATNYASSQYCNFLKPKNKEAWIALHTNEQHDTLTKLKKSVEHRKEKFEPRDPSPNKIAGRLHFPLLVLKDDLYVWNDENVENPLVKVNHVKYIAQGFNENTNYYEDYFIDVIVENYLDKYILEKNNEWEYFKNIITNNRDKIIENQSQLAIQKNFLL